MRVIGKRNKSISIILAAVLAASLFLAAALPGTAVADTASTKTVRFGYYEKKVFEEGAKSGEVKSGYAYEYIRKLSEYTGWRYEYVYGEFNDLRHKLAAGEIDMMAGLPSDDREAARIGYPKEPMGAANMADYYLCVSLSKPDLLKEVDAAQAELTAEEPNFTSYLQTKYYTANTKSRAFSEEEQQWLAQHNTLRVGYLNNYLPYSDSDNGGNVNGQVKDLVPELFKQLGVKDLDIQFFSYNNYQEMISGLNKGIIDVVYPVGGGMYYAEESGIYQSDTVVSSTTELVYTGDYSEDTTKSFAVNQNNSMQYYFVKTNYPKAKISMYNSIDDCLEAVQLGDAGCTTLNGLRANDMLKNSKYKDLSLLQTSVNDDRYFGVAIGNEGLLKLINRGLNALGSDYVQNMVYRYTDELYSYTFLDVMRNNAWAFLIALLVIATLVTAFLARGNRRRKQEVIAKEKVQVALREALVDAESANRAKTTFLNSMSHDIRTPMNAIVGFTDMAAAHVDDPELVREYMDKIALSSQHMLSLINDVLDMSRIESGKVDLEEKDMSLKEMINDTKNIIQASVEDKNQLFAVDTSGIIHDEIVSDKLRIERILINILNNAVKYTPELGAISLRVKELPFSEPGYAKYVFRIKDNGVGMSEEFQKTIFDAFTREKTTTVSGVQGTGLGMSITKSIVDMMGGTISVNSKEGEGSEFIIELPCKISKNKEEEPRISEEELKNLRFDGQRILLAEDNEMNQQIALAILQHAGLTVDVAVNGEEAVRMMQDHPAHTYQAILMDVQMPKMDGYEATRQIRALEDTEKAAVPIIAVTANVFEEDRIIATEAGMNGHLAKPYDIPAMMQTLSDILLH